MPSIFITGANRGIGFECARQYAAQGWTVHAGVRDPANAVALSELPGDLVTVHRLDVTRHDQIAEVADELRGQPIDLLINNAGLWVGADECFGKFSDAQWMEQFRVHVFGPMAMCEAFVEHVAASERKLIVNMSSGNGCFAWPRTEGNYPYDSSKAALNLVTKGLSADLKVRGITVVSITPGNVATDMSGPDADLQPDESVAGMRAVMDGLDLRRTGTFVRYNGESLPW